MPVISFRRLLVRSPVPTLPFTGYLFRLFPFGKRGAFIAHAAGISARFRSFAQAGLYARTPCSADCCALSGNYHLESNLTDT